MEGVDAMTGELDVMQDIITDEEALCPSKRTFIYVFLVFEETLSRNMVHEGAYFVLQVSV